MNQQASIPIRASIKCWCSSEFGSVRFWREKLQLIAAQLHIGSTLYVCYLELCEKEGILEYPLNRFDEVRLQGSGVLLLWIAGGEKLLQRLISLG